jgi:hypothetical protein
MMTENNSKLSLDEYKDLILNEHRLLNDENQLFTNTELGRGYECLVFSRQWVDDFNPIGQRTCLITTDTEIYSTATAVYNAHRERFENNYEQFSNIDFVVPMFEI